MSKRAYIKTGLWILLGAIVLLIARGDSSANDFSVYAGKKYCESVVTDAGRRACNTLSEAKNKACNIKMVCAVDKQKDVIDTYKKAKKQLEDGAVADADKDRLRDKIEKLKSDLDERKAAAGKGIEIAGKCIEARTAVQKWFESTAIPLTANLRDAALKERKGLLSKLEEAQKKVRDAKAKRDANPKDSNLQREWEKATEEMRAVEKQLEAFNSKYGKDVERNANRLIDHYKAEKTRHDAPTEQAENRLEKCKELAGLSY